tara:strand:+ start:806 stop:1186 length:381 start_codon:yes stop_codon:yes gene_type:complete
VTKLINITELAKMLKLVNISNKKPLNYILRFWEKEFKQIRPKYINNRRYYTVEQVELIKKIKFLLKDEGMTIKGAKNILNRKIKKLDDSNSNSLQADYYKKALKDKSSQILEKIKKLKKYGKKNPH